VQEEEKRHRDREKEWCFVMSLSLHAHSNAFTCKTSLTSVVHKKMYEMYACHSHVVAGMLVHLRMFECMLPVDGITAYHVLTTF
jgi:hypothetical protein